MIEINKELCIGCGKCVWDCFPGVMTLEDGKAALTNPGSCLRCGHCIAVCPRNAVTDPELASPAPIGSPCSAHTLLNAMESRRSCRHYQNKPIETETLNMLLDAARACPTAKNLQGTRYIAVTEAMPKLLDAAMAMLGKMGKSQLESATDPDELRRANNFVTWAEKRQQDKDFDPLFFHAPQLLIFVSGKSDVRDAAAAAAYTELMAYHLGLGCLYSGYFTACCDLSAELKELLGVSRQERVVRCLVLGYPDVKFLRTAPRNEANVTYL